MEQAKAEVAGQKRWVLQIREEARLKSSESGLMDCNRDTRIGMTMS